MSFKNDFPFNMFLISKFSKIVKTISKKYFEWLFFSYFLHMYYTTTKIQI